MRHIWMLCASAALYLATGCAMPVDEQSHAEVEGSEEALTANVPVRLLNVHTESVCTKYTAQGTCENNQAQAVAKGFVEVQNLAYDKQVVVHYQGQDGTWLDAAASYVAPTANGWEAWYFETRPKTYTDRLGTDFRFAIRYSVNGQSYWDNNSGNDYDVGAGPRTLYPSVILEASVLTLESAGWNTALNTVTGAVVLKNLAYQKDVRVVYSTDAWKTVRNASASYLAPRGTGIEAWSFQLPVDASATQLEFAVSYTVNGQTYWDNNFGRNYKLTKPQLL